jgi:hypothetical protein
MSDISDLEGVYPTALRWNAEFGNLGCSAYDAATGERGVEIIELGSSMAKFAMDMATRERGYALIRVGVYDMRLTPVGSPPPDYPGDDSGFKPAIGVWLWSPLLNTVRCETNATLFLNAIQATWEQCRGFEEAAQGLVPVIHFVDRREQFVRAVNKTFWVPVVQIVGFIPRDKTPFALREPTVKPWPPLALDSQVNFAQLGAPRREAPTEVQQRLADKLGGTAAPRAASKSATSKRGTKRSAPLERGELSDFLDDEIPDLVRDK